MIDPTCQFYGNARNLLLGNPNLYMRFLSSINPTSRIDAFCVLSGEIDIERRVHVASGCRLMGASDRILLQDGSFVSMGSTLLTGSDTYNDGSAIGPTFPEDLRNVITGPIWFAGMAGCGAHCIIMPGCKLGFASRLGANSFLPPNTVIPAFEIWAGTPAKKIGELNEAQRSNLWKIHDNLELFPK